jgi:hypothetical protein
MKTTERAGEGMITEDHAGANEEAAPFPAPRCTKSLGSISLSCRVTGWRCGASGEGTGNRKLAGGNHHDIGRSKVGMADVTASTGKNLVSPAVWVPRVSPTRLSARAAGRCGCIATGRFSFWNKGGCAQQIRELAIFSHSRCQLEVILSRCCKRERAGGKALVCGEPLKLLGND